MTTSELSKAIAAETEINIIDVEAIVKALPKVIFDQLRANPTSQVKVVGLGVFSSHKIAAGGKAFGHETPKYERTIIKFKAYDSFRILNNSNLS